jgi:hypothetical protein
MHAPNPAQKTPPDRIERPKRVIETVLSTAIGRLASNEQTLQKRLRSPNRPEQLCRVELLVLTTCVCKSIVKLYLGGGSRFVLRIVVPGSLEVITPW